MSYLTGPTVMFTGLFQADVPTENNDATFVGSPPGSEPQNGPNWNPMGGGAFRLLDARTGPVAAAPAPDASDPIVGATVRGAHDRVSAKIVDLDPQWQIASELYGLRIEVVAADGATLLAGEFDPAAFRDSWNPSPGLRNIQARFQSVLQDITWAPLGTSPTVDRLRAATSAGRLSIRITTHGFVGATRTGAVAGAIGPYLLGEPSRFVSGRRFPRTLQAMGAFDAELSPDGSRLSADLATAVSWTVTPTPPLGPLRFGVLTGSDPAIGAEVTDGDEVRLFGDPIPSVDPTWLAATGGIVSVDVPPELRGTVTDHPLALLLAGPTPRLLMRETPDGWLMRADRETRRLDGTPAGGPAPGVTPDDGETWVRVTRYGVPQKDRTPVVTIDGPGPGAPPGADPTILIGAPEGAVVPAAVAPTGDDGWTVLRFACGDPGGPRHPLDGQVYSVTISLPEPAPQEGLGLLVFDAVPVPDDPLWERDVLPILTPYAALYPVMTERLLDMRKYDEVRDRRQILQLALSRPITDPNSMPVTRDLSGPKRATLLKWLALPDLPRDPGAIVPEPGISRAAAVGGGPDAGTDPRDAPFLGKQAALERIAPVPQEGPS